MLVADKPVICKIINVATSVAKESPCDFVAGYIFSRWNYFTKKFANIKIASFVKIECDTTSISEAFSHTTTQTLIS